MSTLADQLTTGPRIGPLTQSRQPRVQQGHRFDAGELADPHRCGNVAPRRRREAMTRCPLPPGSQA